MQRRPVLSWAPTALAVALWFAATLFFLGDIGKLGDDYSVAMRHPETGALDLGNHPWSRWPYFWRPLHLAHASLVNTVSWDHPWIGHLELALVHAVVTWMLVVFLGRMGVRRSIASAVGLLFTVCPLVGGAVLWTTTSCNAISCVFLLWTLELVRRQAVGPWSSARTVGIGMLAFVTACWYEPGAAALLAAPCVFLAASGRPGVSRQKAWRGAVGCTMAAGLGCLVYAALLVATAPAHARGGRESLVTLAEAGPRVRWFCSEVAGALCGSRARDLFRGSFAQGWLALHSPMGWAVAGLLAVLASFAGLAIAKRSPREGEDVPGGRGHGFVVLTGAAIFVGAWLPILIVPTQGVALRSLYVPVLGLAVVVAGLANG